MGKEAGCKDALGLTLQYEAWIRTDAPCKMVPAELKSMYGKTRHDNIGSEVRGPSVFPAWSPLEPFFGLPV
jgi:hypothetical protein